MARIPRSDPNVRLAMADQPTMSPDALTGPGRALQGLGRAISGLQGAFEAAAEPTDNEKFDAQLKQLQFHNESLDELQRRQAEFTPDNNPSTFTPEYQDWYNTKSQEYRGSISQNPKIQQNWQLNDERLGGEIHRRAYGFQTDETTKRTVDTVISTFTGTIAKAPSGNAQAMADLVDMIDGQIGRVQGASPAQVEGMRNSLRDAAIKQLLLSVDPVDQPKVLEDFVGATVRDKSAPQPSDGLAPLGELPQQGLPGSQSGPAAGPQSSLSPIPQTYVDKVKGFEGFNAKPYWDYKQWTSGYGTRAKSKGEVISREEAETRLNAELGKAARNVDRFKPGLPEGTRAALVSLTYNSGTKWMSGGLGEAVKSGDSAAIKERLVQYNKAGGQTLPGLVQRRNAEALWIGEGAPVVASKEAPQEPVQVADASGRIPGSVISGQVKDRVESGERAPNTIPGAQQTADSRPQWVRPSIRTGMTEQLIKMRGAVQEQQRRALDALIDRAEKSAADGYMLPDEERALINQKMGQYGTVEMQARLKNAEDAANVTAQLKKLTPTQVAGQEAQLRAAMSQAGATPDVIAKAKAVEGLHTRMVKELNENPVGWAAEAGLIPPQQPITPETFTTEALQLRKQVVDGISAHYGPEFRKYFTKDERENLTAIFEKGGEPMVVMMGRMYDAFGDDMPRAVTEIAPKAPEAVRAGYLLATGGNPLAVKDIASTIARRADPNYKGGVDAGDTEGLAREVLGDVFRKFPQQARDATLRAAEAIYIARVDDPKTPDPELFRQSLKEAMGERANALGVPFGGVVETRPGALWGTSGDAVVLPSNVRKDTWREMMDSITTADLKAANQPIPVDGNGTPISMTRALNGRLVQTGPGKYVVSLGDPDVRGAEKWVMATPAPPPEGIALSVPLKPSEPFVLDLGALTPILRKRMPDLFWSE